uniref:Uncharacterized protein MANES_01G237200 n=1 Tax=Rhizophora mucronata TaxID=61149 RepID=A0A2P2KES5_RHIMU
MILKNLGAWKPKKKKIQNETYSKNTNFNTSLGAKNLHKHGEQLPLIGRHLHLATSQIGRLLSQLPQNLGLSNVGEDVLVKARGDTDYLFRFVSDLLAIRNYNGCLLLLLVVFVDVAGREGTISSCQTN